MYPIDQRPLQLTTYSLTVNQWFFLSDPTSKELRLMSDMDRHKECLRMPCELDSGGVRPDSTIKTGAKGRAAKSFALS